MHNSTIAASHRLSPVKTHYLYLKKKKKKKKEYTGKKATCVHVKALESPS